MQDDYVTHTILVQGLAPVTRVLVAAPTVGRQQDLGIASRSKEAQKKLIEGRCKEVYQMMLGDSRGEAAAERFRGHVLGRGGSESLGGSGSLEFKKRFIEELSNELSQRYKDYGRVHQKLELFRSDQLKLKLAHQALAKQTQTSQASPASLEVCQTKLDIGIVSGVLSPSKIMDCRGPYGENSLYYTVQQGEMGNMFKSNKYFISRKDSLERMQENESTSSDSVRPEWAETYTFTLTGEPDEVLTFEIFRHNSCEGALQLDFFEIKLREDPILFELLSDQKFHHLTYNSTLMSPLMHQPSFETDNSRQETGGEKGSAHQTSTFQVIIRWRYDEESVKLSQIQKQIAQIALAMSELSDYLAQKKARYDQLLSFKDRSIMKFMDLWGLPQVLNESPRQSPIAKTSPQGSQFAMSPYRTAQPHQDPLRESLLTPLDQADLKSIERHLIQSSSSSKGLRIPSGGLSGNALAMESYTPGKASNHLCRGEASIITLGNKSQKSFSRQEADEVTDRLYQNHGHRVCYQAKLSGSPLDGQLSSYRPMDQQSPKRERGQPGRDGKHTYDNPTMSQQIRDEITRKKSQDKFNGQRPSPFKRNSNAIPVFKSAINQQQVTATSKSKEKLGGHRTKVRNLGTSLGVSHSSNQILHLDPALIHRAMHEDIKGAIPAHQQSARVKPASFSLKKGEGKQKHFQSAVLTPNQFAQSYREGQSNKSNVQSAKKVDVSTISQKSAAKKQFNIPKPLMRKKDPALMNPSKPKNTIVKKPLLPGSSSLRLPKAQKMIPFFSNLAPKPKRGEAELYSHESLPDINQTMQENYDNDSLERDIDADNSIDLIGNNRKEVFILEKVNRYIGSDESSIGKSDYEDQASSSSDHEEQAEKEVQGVDASQDCLKKRLWEELKEEDYLIFGNQQATDSIQLVMPLTNILLQPSEIKDELEDISVGDNGQEIEEAQQISRILMPSQGKDHALLRNQISNINEEPEFNLAPSSSSSNNSFHAEECSPPNLQAIVEEQRLQPPLDHAGLEKYPNLQLPADNTESPAFLEEDQPLSVVPQPQQPVERPLNDSFSPTQNALLSEVSAIKSGEIQEVPEEQLQPSYLEEDTQVEITEPTHTVTEDCQQDHQEVQGLMQNELIVSEVPLPELQPQVDPVESPFIKEELNPIEASAPEQETIISDAQLDTEFIHQAEYLNQNPLEPQNDRVLTHIDDHEEQKVIDLQYEEEKTSYQSLEHLQNSCETQLPADQVEVEHTQQLEIPQEAHQISCCPVSGESQADQNLESVPPQDSPRLQPANNLVKEDSISIIELQNPFKEHLLDDNTQTQILQELSETKEVEEMTQIRSLDQDHTKQVEKHTEGPTSDAISRKKLRKKLQKKRQKELKKFNSQLHQIELDESVNQDQDDKEDIIEQLIVNDSSIIPYQIESEVTAKEMLEAAVQTSASINQTAIQEQPITQNDPDSQLKGFHRPEAQSFITAEIIVPVQLQTEALLNGGVLFPDEEIKDEIIGQEFQQVKKSKRAHATKAGLQALDSVEDSNLIPHQEMVEFVEKSQSIQEHSPETIFVQHKLDPLPKLQEFQVQEQEDDASEYDYQFLTDKLDSFLLQQTINYQDPDSSNATLEYVEPVIAIEQPTHEDKQPNDMQEQHPHADPEAKFSLETCKEEEEDEASLNQELQPVQEQNENINNSHESSIQGKLDQVPDIMKQEKFTEDTKCQIEELENQSQKVPEEANLNREESSEDMLHAENFLFPHEDQENNDLVKDFLKGDHMIEENKDIDNNFASDDDIDSNNLHGTPQNLSDASSDHFQEPIEPGDTEVEILAPTLANMKKIELKNQRKAMDGSLATSNILDLLQPRLQGSQASQEQDSRDMATPPMNYHFSQNNMNFPLLSGSFYGRPSVPVKKLGLFGDPSARPVRSTINEPMTGKHFQAGNQSIHSGGSAKIGLLMKSLDGGALFSRHALAKQQKSPLERSLASSQGYEGIGSKIFKNQQMSDQGSQKSGGQPHIEEEVKMPHETSLQYSQTTPQAAQINSGNEDSHSGLIFMQNQMMGLKAYASAAGMGNQVPKMPWLSQSKQSQNSQENFK